MMEKFVALKTLIYNECHLIYSNAIILQRRLKRFGVVFFKDVILTDVYITVKKWFIVCRCLIL